MIRFTKMHGIGNDYVYLDAVTDPALAERPDLAELTRTMSHRHEGVGADGLIVISRPDADSGIPEGHGVQMRMFNADGSEGEMCGNGIRCVAKYAVDHGLVEDGVNPIPIQTAARVLNVECVKEDGRVTSVTVDMGEPILELEKIPVRTEALDDRGAEQSFAAEHVHRLHVNTLGRRRTDPPRTLEAVFVSMGNPHAVFFQSEIEALSLDFIGPLIERHTAFPNRINVHFAEVLSPKEVRMRTWERGSGITRACGTGAAAVCVAGALRGRSERKVLIHLPGGDLQFEWRESDNHIYMTGPAEEVFSGEWPA